MKRTCAVPGISCGHCKSAIEGEVSNIPAVVDVEVDVDNQTVVVEGEASEESIRTAIDEAGYDVAAVS
ncbi:MAG: heavy-metal-associated domain-containing protein [Nitriliruptorales bacterium]